MEKAISVQLPQPFILHWMGFKHDLILKKKIWN